MNKAYLSIQPPSPKRQTRRSAPKIYEDSVLQIEAHEAEAKAGRPSRSIRSVRRTEKATTNTTAPKHGKLLLSVDEVQEQPSEVSDENALPSIVATPTTSRFKDVFASTTPSTPKHRVRLTGRLLTPRTTPSKTSDRPQNVYSRGRQLFTQSGSSKIIGREAERDQLSKFISKAIESQRGGCTYVSGPPGTGKSALVHEVLEGFQDQCFKVVTINCVAMKTSSDVLAKFCEEFCMSSSGRQTTKTSLSRLFTSEGPNKTMSVVLMDEIDALVSSDCELLYNIFEWAMHPSSSLVLIGIANALDLTDRFLPRLKQKNMQPQLLPFLPYSAQQISSIISTKLRSLLPAEVCATSDFVPLMHPAAIQLSGKKIASQTGDLRKAFSLVRQAINRVEQETILKMNGESSVTPTKQPLGEIRNPRANVDASKSNERNLLTQMNMETAPRVTIAHVAKIAANFFNNSAISRLNGLNLQQKAVLCSLLASENRNNKRDPFKTPSKSWSRIATVKELFETYGKLCRRDEGLLQPLKNTEFRDVVASLETLGLVHEASGRLSGVMTPSSTPSRNGKVSDDKQIVSAITEKEMRDGLQGAGSDLLRRLLDEE
ncbi:hypothetical protein B0A52_02749 [Exophiala mesophila]|uniref:Cell division control protein n=1 Tax=Exophiala mesophila TaxID=212818 RepID=A0A438NDY3_EXOME|nr:hypothetical protein B0A52_02749 [Exophiala mesophila]